MDIMNIVDAAIKILWNHSMLIMLVCFLLYNHWKSKQPFPDSGGRVTGIHGEKDWEEKVKHGSLVCVDFYATWCPPCRTDAPWFGQTSLKYGTTDFVKVDVDECKSIARMCSVSAMPTFQLYKNGEKIDESVGYNPSSIEAMIKKAGGLVGQAPPKAE